MNLTNLIYVLLGGLSGVVATLLGRRFIKNASKLSFFVAILIIVTMGLIRVYLIPYYRATTYEYFVQRDDPAIALIAERYPKQFETYINNTKKSLFENESQSIEQLYKINLLNIVTAQAMLKASNASIYDVYQIEVELYKNLYEIDPKLVLFLEFSGQFRDKPNPNLIIILGGGPDMIQRIVAAKEKVVLSAIKSPQPPMDIAQNKATEKMVSDIFAKISASYGPDTFVNLTVKPDSPDIDPKTAALMIIAFYSDILDKGVNQAGMIFKYLNTPEVKEAPH